MPDEADPSASELTPRLGRVAMRTLAAHGFTRYDHLTGVSSRHLLGLHGVGPKAIRILEEELAARGLAFAGAGRGPDTA